MKITLIGDSIRQQYEPKVRELLGNEFEIWSPEDNCRFAQYTLRGLFDWAKEMEGSEIVHFNCGHWDVCRLFEYGTFTDEAEYVKTMSRILDIFEARGFKVIFATTTPVREANLYNKNEDIKRFNQLISDIVRERGGVVNDLYSLLAGDVDANIREDMLHLSDEGKALCAQQVAACIRDVAKRIPKVENGKGTCESDQSGAPVLI